MPRSRVDLGTVNQAPTILSLLTPEYQKRMVQMNYHEAVTNAPQWEASFCYPEGFIRWWAQASRGGNFQLTMTPTQVQFLSGIADNFLRQVLIGTGATCRRCRSGTARRSDSGTAHAGRLDREHPGLDAVALDVRVQRQAGDDRNLQAALDAGGKFVGLDHETIFYDPEAFVAPLHARDALHPRGPRLDDPDRRYTYIECLSNIRNTNGRPTQLTARDPRYIDYYGRPWAQNWEKYFEEGWDKPQEDAAPKDVLDLFKGGRRRSPAAALDPPCVGRSVFS